MRVPQVAYHLCAAVPSISGGVQPGELPAGEINPTKVPRYFLEGQPGLQFEWGAQGAVAVPQPCLIIESRGCEQGSLSW